MNQVLLRFLRTGELGPLKCGLAREEVRRLLGDPQSWDGRESQAADWRYDFLSVYFEEHCVIGYGLAFELGRPFPACIDGLAWVSLPMPMQQVRDALNSAKILFECSRSNKKRDIRTEGGVWVFRDPEDNVMNMVFACPGPNSLQWLDEYHRAPQENG